MASPASGCIQTWFVSSLGARFPCALIQSQTYLEVQNLSSPPQKFQNTKSPPFFHSCTAKPVSRIRKHTEACWKTCRTRFDDAVEQSRLSDNTPRLSFLNPACAARGELSRWLKVRLLKSRISASAVSCGFRSFMAVHGSVVCIFFFFLVPHLRDSEGLRREGVKEIVKNIHIFAVNLLFLCCFTRRSSQSESSINTCFPSSPLTNMRHAQMETRG